MFKLIEEFALEIDAPARETWDFFANPTNWARWMPEVASCEMQSSFKAGSKIKIKIRNKPNELFMFLTEVVPYREYKLVLNSLLGVQESTFAIESISKEKTRATFRVGVIGALVPFMKSFFKKRIKETFMSLERESEYV